jgi:chromosome segregation ATPase
MSAEETNTTGQDTEKGFGTGLRAQLAKRNDAAAPAPEAPEAAPQSTSAEPAFVVYGTAEAEAVKAELAAAGERERDLRDELDELRARLEAAEHANTEASSARSAEVDARAAKVAGLETALEERERELAERASATAAEQQRLADLKAELAATETRQS